jgi:hypothetical protein
MPSDLSDASSYLYSAASNASGYLLILPMSDTSVYQMEFNGSPLTDTSSLFTYLSPIPIIDVNASTYDSQLFNFLWEMNYTNLVPVLQVMHISYVIFNPYFQSVYPGFYPGGRVSNITLFLNYVYSKLLSEIGKPVTYGSVSIFKVPSTVPLAYAVKNLNFVSTKSFQNYLGFISSLRNSVNLSNIENLIWTNRTSMPFPYPYIQPIPFNGFSIATNISGADQIDMVNSKGSINEVWNRTSGIHSNFVRLVNTSMLSIKTQDIRYYHGILNNSISHYSEMKLFNFTSNEKHHLMINLNISNIRLANDSWNYLGVIFDEGGYSFEISFDANMSQSAYFYNLQAFHDGQQYAWNYVRGGNYSYYFQGNDQMTVYLNNDSLEYTMTSLTYSKSYNSPRFYFNPAYYFRDPGYNLSLIRDISGKFMNSSLDVSMFLNLGTNLTNASASIPLPYSYVVLARGNPLENNIINSTFKYDPQGNIILNLNKNQPVKNYFIVFGLKNSNYWQILSENIKWQRLGISKFYTIFSISDPNAYTHIEIGINRNLSTLIYASMVAPIIEIAFMPVCYVTRKKNASIKL